MVKININLFRRCNGNIPEFNRSMISLNQYRARFPFLTIDRPACNSWNQLIRDYGYTICNHRYLSSDQRDIKSLPFTASFATISLGVKNP